MIGPYWVWIKVGIAVLALAIAYRQGGASERAACAKESTARLEAQIAETERWQQRAYKADEALRKAQRPKSAPKIEEVVNANPSGCSVPKPVGDRLRDEIERGNAALSG